MTPLRVWYVYRSAHKSSGYTTGLVYSMHMSWLSRICLSYIYFILTIEKNVVLFWHFWFKTIFWAVHLSLNKIWSHHAFLLWLFQVWLFQDIQIFVYLSFPLFFSVSHCFRGWFKKNLKVYDVINCLNKNVITHVWCLEKEMRCDIETLSIDKVLNTEHFYGKKSCRKCAPKVSPRPLFNFSK